MIQQKVKCFVKSWCTGYHFRYRPAREWRRAMNKYNTHMRVRSTYIVNRRLREWWISAYKHYHEERRWDILYLQIVRTLYCTCLVIHMMSLVEKAFHKPAFFQVFCVLHTNETSDHKTTYTARLTLTSSTTLVFWAIFSSLTISGHIHVH